MISKAGTCGKYMKEANPFKNCYVFIHNIIMYIYQEILDAKKGDILFHYGTVPV